MLRTTIPDQCLIEIRIAVNAAVSACIISTYIDTYHAATGGTLIFVSINGQSIISDSLQAGTINTTGMSYSKSAEVYMFRTGINRKPYSFAVSLKYPANSSIC